MNTGSLSLRLRRYQGWVGDWTQRQQGKIRYDWCDLGDAIFFHPYTGEWLVINACMAGRDAREHQERYRDSSPLSCFRVVSNSSFCLDTWKRVKPRGKRAHLVYRPFRAGWVEEHLEWRAGPPVDCHMDGTPMNEQK